MQAEQATIGAQHTIGRKNPKFPEVTPPRGPSPTPVGEGLRGAGHVYELQEFRPGPGIFAESARHVARDHGDRPFVYPARRHAFVRRIDDDPHPPRLQHLLHATGGLGGHFLLHLGTSRKTLDDPCKLADTDDLVGRQVTDMRAADDRRHVMLAVRFELDVSQHDHLVIAGHFLKGAAQILAGIDGIAREPFTVCLNDAARRIEQPFASWIIARPPIILTASASIAA